MNKFSRFWWFCVLVQACAVVAVVEWHIHRAQIPRYAITGTHVEMEAGIKTALDAFAVDCGRYPTTAEGFQALINCPTNLFAGKWHGPYLDEIPQDPWKHIYVYRCPSIHTTNGYDIYSCGPDGISKSGGNDLDDINTWDPSSPHGGNFPDTSSDKPLSFQIMFTFLTMPFLFGV